MDLTSAANVRAYAGLSTADISDVNLGILVSRASAVIRGYCSRDITAEGPYTETFDGPGGARFCPVQWPITAVSAVSVDGLPIPAATTATAPGYVFTSGQIALRGYAFPRGLANCTVVYTAGEASVPADVEHACILTVMEAYNAACRDPAVRSEALPGGMGYQATFTPMSIPAPAKAILDQSPYVRRWS